MSVWILGAWTLLALAFVGYSFWRALFGWLASSTHWFPALIIAGLLAGMFELFVLESLPRLIITATSSVMALITGLRRRQRGAAA